MSEVTLESLAARIAALEARLSNPPPPVKDWRSVIGMFDDDPGFQDVIDEINAIREAERVAVRAGKSE
jgi:hypothetical protein